jgi:prolipoprotein diacylglyceryl transferase
VIHPLSIPSPPPGWTGFTIGIFTIHTYALCILAGIVVGVLLTGHRLRQRGAEAGVVLDVSFFAVLLGITAARFYHVFTHPDDYFAPGVPFWKIFAIWEGGNAIFGALIGGAVGVWIGCRLTGIRFLAFADAMAPGLLLAQGIGRLGNYFNTELYGMPTNLPWGLQVPSSNPAFPLGLPEGTLFHPTFLYELIWDVAGALLILVIENRLRDFPPRFPLRFEPRLPLRWGRGLAFYLVWYGIGRSVFESIRIDPSEVFFGLRVNVWAAFAAVLLGLILFAAARRHPGSEPGVYRPGRQRAPAKSVDSPDTEAADDHDQPGSETVAQPSTSGSAARR